MTFLEKTSNLSKIQFSSCTKMPQTTKLLQHFLLYGKLFIKCTK